MFEVVVGRPFARIDQFRPFPAFFEKFGVGEGVIEYDVRFAESVQTFDCNQTQIAGSRTDQIYFSRHVITSFFPSVCLRFLRL